MNKNNRSLKMTFGRYDYAIFHTFFSYAAASVVLPVALVSLARDLGFSLENGGMSAGGALHFGRTVSMVVSLLLCGFIAGRWGKRKTLGISVLLMGFGILICAFAPFYGVLFLALLIAGLGEGVVEGLATPFVADLHSKESGRYNNFTHSFWSVGVMFTVLATGGLLSLGISWRLVVAATALLSVFAATMLLLPEKKGHEYPDYPEAVHWKTTWDHASKIFSSRRFWLFFAAMFLAGGGEFCLTFWCASFIQLNFIDAAWAGGVGTACFAGGMVLGRTGWGYFIKQHQLKHLIVWSGIAGAIITLSFPFLNNLWLLFGILFLSGIATAPFWPSIQSYSVDRLPGTDSTMLYILLACAGIPGCGTFTWLMGYIGNHAGGLRTAFYLVPACYIILAGLIGYDWWKSSSKISANNRTA
ncbi:MAG: MFS transporter [Armatimonadota bacterium]